MAKHDLLDLLEYISWYQNTDLIWCSILYCHFYLSRFTRTA